MKVLIRKFYFLLVGPLYRRLSREITLQNQEMLAKLLCQNEDLINIVSNEVVKMHVSLQEQQDEPSLTTVSDTIADCSVPLSDYQIAQVCASIKVSTDIIKTSQDWKLPVADIVALERKYGGMDASAVQKVRKLETENLKLRHELSALQLRQKGPESNAIELEMK